MLILMGNHVVRTTEIVSIHESEDGDGNYCSDMWLRNIDEPLQFNNTPEELFNIIKREISKSKKLTKKLQFDKKFNDFVNPGENT